MALSIDELLKSLQDPTTGGLVGSVSEIWARIGSRDDFAELNLDETEMKKVIQDWIAENPYNNIK
jgi:hypothetical protein